MEGLRSLKVILNEMWMPKSRETEAQLFAPMCSVKGLEVFDVEVAWSPRGSGYTMGLDYVPYTIKKTPRRRQIV